MLNTATTILRDKSKQLQSRLDAMLYIVEYFEAEHFPIFEDILKDPSEHPDVRSAAALALGKIGREQDLQEECFDVLLPYAHSDDITVKNYAVQALGMLKTEKAVPVLLEALGDENNTVFASAAEALGEVGKPAVPHLIRLLDQGDADDARCIAAWQLGNLRYTDAVPTLVKVIQQDKNTELLALCIWALGEIGFGPQEVLEILNWAKTQQDPDISNRAKRAIKKIARHCN